MVMLLLFSIRFEIQVLEGDVFRVLFHRNGITVLNDSTDFESFDQFFDSKSPEYRQSLPKSVYVNQNYVRGSASAV